MAEGKLRKNADFKNVVLEDQLRSARCLDDNRVSQKSSAAD
jgi:hypothetical protein